MGGCASASEQRTGAAVAGKQVKKHKKVGKSAKIVARDASWVEENRVFVAGDTAGRPSRHKSLLIHEIDSSKDNSYRFGGFSSRKIKQEISINQFENQRVVPESDIQESKVSSSLSSSRIMDRDVSDGGDGSTPSEEESDTSSSPGWTSSSSLRNEVWRMNQIPLVLIAPEETKFGPSALEICEDPTNRGLVQKHVMLKTRPKQVAEKEFRLLAAGSQICGAIMKPVGIVPLPDGLAAVATPLGRFSLYNFVRNHVITPMQEMKRMFGVDLYGRNLDIGSDDKLQISILPRHPTNFPTHVCLETLQQIAAALYSYHHEFKTIQSEVELDNVVVMADGAIKLVDMAHAKTIGEKMSKLGPSLFMTPPELLKYHRYKDPFEIRADAASDVFGFGVLAFELSFGMNPYMDINSPWISPPDKEVAAAMEMISLEPLAWSLATWKVDLLNANFDEQVSEMIQNCLNPKKEERPSMKEVLRLLSAKTEGTSKAQRSLFSKLIGLKRSEDHIQFALEFRAREIADAEIQGDQDTKDARYKQILRIFRDENIFSDDSEAKCVW